MGNDNRKSGGTVVKKYWKTTMVKWLLLPMLLVSLVGGVPAKTQAEESLNLNVDAAVLLYGNHHHARE